MHKIGVMFVVQQCDQVVEFAFHQPFVLVFGHVVFFIVFDGIGDIRLFFFRIRSGGRGEFMPVRRFRSRRLCYLIFFFLGIFFLIRHDDHLPQTVSDYDHHSIPHFFVFVNRANCEKLLTNRIVCDKINRIKTVLADR